MQRNEQRAKKRRRYFTGVCIWLFSPNKLEIIYPRGLKCVCLRVLHPVRRECIMQQQPHTSCAASRAQEKYLYFIYFCFHLKPE